MIMAVGFILLFWVFSIDEWIYIFQIQIQAVLFQSPIQSKLAYVSPLAHNIITVDTAKTSE